MTKRAAAAILALIMVGGWAASPAVAQAPLASATQPVEGAHRRGAFQANFTERSPMSTIGAQRLRYGLERQVANIYQTPDETFAVYVPPSYKPDDQWGLLVWANAGGSGAVVRGWMDLLDRKKLIWIGADNVGNDRGIGVRIGLALDSVWNMKQRYSVDDNRIYIAGVSGGGKIAGIAGIAFPDVFDGAIACVGMNFYKDIPHPTRANAVWPGTFRHPPRRVLDEARNHVGFALITGENDPNREPITAVYHEGFQHDQFKHVTLMDIPGMAHEAPSAEVLEQAINTLDAVPRTGRHKQPLVMGTTRATDPNDEARSIEAARLLGLARSYNSAGRKDKARELFQQILDEYGDTEEANVARTMIKKIKQ